MSRLHEIYTENLHDHFKTLYASWPPNLRVDLGAFGIMERERFRPLGDVAAFGVRFEQTEPSKPAHYDFSSSSSTEIVLHGKGTGPAGGPATVNASLEINFSKEDSVFLNAADCRHRRIVDQLALGEEILKLYHNGTWSKEFVLVTEVVDAGSTTLVVSGGSKSSIVLEAEGDVPNIDLADAKLGFTVKRQRNVAFKLIAAAGMTPFIGLGGVETTGLPWSRKDVFEPQSITMLEASAALEPREPEGEPPAFFRRIP